MGILEHTSNFQNCIKKTNKIPEYAREFKNEYLFIRGTNKTCERFIKILDLDAKIFNSPQAYQLKSHFLRKSRIARHSSKYRIFYYFAKTSLLVT